MPGMGIVQQSLVFAKVVLGLHFCFVSLTSKNQIMQEEINNNVYYVYMRNGVEYMTPCESIAILRSTTGEYKAIEY